MDNLELYSLNANGLRDRVKRQTVLSHFKKRQAGIVLLQETHTVPDAESDWNSISKAKCFFRMVLVIVKG